MLGGFRRRFKTAVNNNTAVIHPVATGVRQGLGVGADLALLQLWLSPDTVEPFVAVQSRRAPGREGGREGGCEEGCGSEGQKSGDFW